MLSDIRFAFRSLLKAPAFTFAAIICIALGVGANAAIFSVVNGVLLRPLPYPNAERLLAIWEREERADAEQRNVVSPANYLDWKAGSRSFEHIGATSSRRAALTGVADPEELAAQTVTASVFAVLGVQPALGRVITDHDEAPGTPNVAVLSDALWRRRFGANPAVIGTTITLMGQTTEIVGVMPPSFRTLDADAEVWLPFGLDPARNYRERSGRFMSVLARLKPGVSVEQAAAELEGIAKRLQVDHPAYNAGWGVTVVPLHEQFVGDMRRPLAVLTGVVAFVLLIACANVANLQLTRAAGRQQEIAVRSALGAARWRLVRQLLGESVLLAVVGGALGLLGASWAVQLLVRGARDLPMIGEVGIDLRVVLFTAALTMLTALAFGLMPALGASRLHLSGALREGGRGTAGGRQRVRSVLAGAQVAMALVLLVGAGLLLKSFDRLTRQSPGFAPENVLTAQVTPPRSRYATDVARAQLVDRVVQRVRAIPGVVEAGAVNWLPFTGQAATGLTIPGRPPVPAGEEPNAEVRAVTPGYFRAMGIPLLAGEVMSGRESADGEVVVVINETLAKRFFPGESPLGRSVTVAWGNPTTTGRVIGVVGDVRSMGLDAEPEPTTYWSTMQLGRSLGQVGIAVRLAPGASGVKEAMLREVRAEDADLPLSEVKMMEVHLAESVARRRLTTTLVSAFGGVALLLAVVGLYGVIAYTVAQRTREIGLRLALGARTGDVKRLVLRQGLQLTLAGIGVGFAGALALSRVLAASLYDVKATDPLVFAGVAALLAVVALVASYLPAARAAKVDPMAALRSE